MRVDLNSHPMKLEFIFSDDGWHRNFGFSFDYVFLRSTTADILKLRLRGVLWLFQQRVGSLQKGISAQVAHVSVCFPFRPLPRRRGHGKDSCESTFGCCNRLRPTFLSFHSTLAKKFSTCGGNLSRLFTIGGWQVRLSLGIARLSLTAKQLVPLCTTLSIGISSLRRLRNLPTP
jgi:hypothetical protein